MRRLLTPGWLAGHLLALTLVAGMLVLAGWQLSRAAGGNPLSWGYTVQWPVFAGFVVLIWVREARRALRGGRPHDGPSPDAPRPGARRPVVVRAGRGPAGASTDGADPELAAYNRYLAWLHAHPEARPTDYPAHDPG